MDSSESFVTAPSKHIHLDSDCDEDEPNDSPPTSHLHHPSIHPVISLSNPMSDILHMQASMLAEMTACQQTITSTRHFANDRYAHIKDCFSSHCSNLADIKQSLTTITMKTAKIKRILAEKAAQQASRQSNSRAATQINNQAKNQADNLSCQTINMPAFAKRSQSSPR